MFAFYIIGILKQTKPKDGQTRPNPNKMSKSIYISVNYLVKRIFKEKRLNIIIYIFIINIFSKNLAENKLELL